MVGIFVGVCCKVYAILIKTRFRLGPSGITEFIVIPLSVPKTLPL